MGPVRADADSGKSTIGHSICTSAAMGFHAHRIDTAVRPPALGDLVETFADIFVVEIYRFGARARRHRNALRNTIDRHDVTGAQHLRAANAELSYRAAAPDGNRIAIFD